MVDINPYRELSAAWRDESLPGEDGEEGEVVAVADLVVVGVVGGGDLDGTGAEVHLDHLVRDDGDLAVSEGMMDFTAVELLVPLVL